MNKPLSKEEIKEITDGVVAEVKGVYETLETKHASIEEIVTELKKKAENDETLTDLEGRMKDMGEEIKKVSEQADEVDTKLSRLPGGSNSLEAKSLGAQVAESDEYKALAKKGSGSSGMIEVKAITNAGNEVAAQTLNALHPRHHIEGVVGIPDQPLTVRDLMPVGQTSSSSLEYARETLFTNNAATVAENTTKPESDIAYTLESANVTTIAHWIPASKQVLADAPMLASMIDGRLRFGLAFEEEQQLLLGDGTGTNLNGVNTQAVAFDQSAATNGIPGGVAATQVDVARWVKLQVRKSFYPATAILMNPEDWATIELLKDADDNYLFSAFQAGAEPRLWGMRVVEADSIAVGEFLVGSFALGAQIWDREMAAVEVSTENSDNFVKNMCTIRAEERLALTVYRPAAFMNGEFAIVA